MVFHAERQQASLTISDSEPRGSQSPRGKEFRKYYEAKKIPATVRRTSWGGNQLMGAAM